MNTTPDPETANWAGGTDDMLHDRLAAVGLVKPREQNQTILAAFGCWRVRNRLLRAVDA